MMGRVLVKIASILNLRDVTPDECIIFSQGLGMRNDLPLWNP